MTEWQTLCDRLLQIMQYMAWLFLPSVVLWLNIFWWFWLSRTATVQYRIGCIDVMASLVGISLAPPARGGMIVSNLQALEDWLAHPVLSSGVVLINCVSFVASRYLRCLQIAGQITNGIYIIIDNIIIFCGCLPSTTLWLTFGPLGSFNFFYLANLRWPFLGFLS